MLKTRIKVVKKFENSKLVKTLYIPQFFKKFLWFDPWNNFKRMDFIEYNLSDDCRFVDDMTNITYVKGFLRYVHKQYNSPVSVKTETVEYLNYP